MSKAHRVGGELLITELSAALAPSPCTLSVHVLPAAHNKLPFFSHLPSFPSPSFFFPLPFLFSPFHSAAAPGVQSDRTDSFGYASRNYLPTSHLPEPRFHCSRLAHSHDSASNFNRSVSPTISRRFDSTRFDANPRFDDSVSFARSADDAVKTQAELLPPRFLPDRRPEFSCLITRASSSSCPSRSRNVLISLWRGRRCASSRLEMTKPSICIRSSRAPSFPLSLSLLQSRERRGVIYLLSIEF